MPNTSCLSRRRLLAGSVTLGVGIPLIAGCAGGAASPPASGSALASTADIEVGGGLILEQERIVITQPTAGEFKAFSATCTHQGCLVTGVAESIDCACHGSAFSVTDGSVLGGPAPTALPEIPIKVEGGKITAA